MKRFLSVLLIILLLLFMGYLTMLKYGTKEKEDVVTILNLMCTKTNQRNSNVSENYTLHVEIEDNKIILEYLKLEYAYIDSISKTNDELFIESINNENMLLDEKYDGINYAVVLPNDINIKHNLGFDIDILMKENFFESSDYNKYSNIILKNKDEFLDKIKGTEYTCKKDDSTFPFRKELNN